MSSRSEQPPENKMTAGSDMVGREDFMRRLIDQLICDADDSSKLRVISVLGERAIGKTALVRSVYDWPDIKRHFKSRAWVRVLPGSVPEDILFDVLRQTTTCKQSRQEQRLCKMLQETLIKQRYLVVLDNLQSVDLMKKLLESFEISSKGTRVIITTCNENMFLHPGPQHSGRLQLRRLTEEKSHELLRKSCRTSDLELTRSILGKCNGYPPVIWLVGQLLSTDREYLHSILAILADGVPNYHTLGKIIPLSYDSLPARLRPCLLYLVLFPREFEIPVRRLFNIWLADGLLSSGDCTQECLNALVTRNMIHVVRRKLDGSAKTCLMPGFLHDFMSEMAMDVGKSEISDGHMSMSSGQPNVSSIAVKILMSANGEQEMLVRTNTFKLPRQMRATNMLSLSHNSMKHQSCPPLELQYIAIKTDEDNRQCKQMHISNGAKTQYVAKFFRSFMLFTTWKQGEHAKEIETFLKPLGLRRCFPWLKVLDLEHVYKPTLPKRLGKIMLNLQYLGLRWTALVSLPRSIQFMSHLHTLDLKHTNVASVPSSILKNGSLQHLYMNEVCLDRSIRRTASYRRSLANLKTLCGLYIGRKSAMLDVLGKLTGLQKLGLTCHYMVADAVAKSVAKLTNLQSLRLKSSDIFDHPSHLDLSYMINIQSLSNLYLIGALMGEGLNFPRNVQILTLSMTQLQEDPMQVLRELRDLTCLRLLAGSYMGQSMTCTEGTFPALRVLKLWKLELLTEWRIEASALPHLQELEIRNCTRLTRIVGLEHVKDLEEITLTKVKGAVAKTAEAKSLKAVVIARELTISPPQEGHDDSEEADNEKSHEAVAETGDDSVLEESDSSDGRGTDEGADEEEEPYDANEEDDSEESNGFDHEAGDDNDDKEGDSNVDRGTDEGADEEQEGCNDNKEEDEEESNGGEVKARDDNDRAEGDSNDNRETDERAYEEQEVGHGNDCKEGDSNDAIQTDGAAEERENGDEDEAANGIVDGVEDKDEMGDGGDKGEKKEKEGGEEQKQETEDKADQDDSNDYEGDNGIKGNDNGEDEENDYEKRQGDDDSEGGAGGGDENKEEGNEEREKDKDEKQKNETIANDGDDSDYQSAYSDIEGNDEGEDPERQNTNKAEDEDENNYEEREENEEEEDEDNNEEGDNNVDGNDEGEDEEKQIINEVVDENDSEKGEDDDDGKGGKGGGDRNEEEGNDERGKDEDKKQKNETKANVGDDSDYQDAYSDIKGNEGENLEQQNIDESKDEDEDNYEEREENEAEEDEDDSEEGDNNNDEGNDEGENEEQQIVNEAVDENYFEEGEDDDDGEGKGGGDGKEEERNDEKEKDKDEKQKNETKANDGADSDYQGTHSDIEGNDEGEDLELQNVDEAEDEDEDNYEKREENEEEEDEDNNEERDNNDDERNDEGEDEEQQSFDEAIDENENDHDEKEDGNSGKEEEKENQNGAEAEDGDDCDYERGDLNDDGGEIKSCKMNMKLELNMEIEANMKNELTLSVVWMKTKDDK